MAVALTLEYLFLWFLLYAFIGWVYESVLVSVSERRIFTDVLRSSFSI